MLRALSGVERRVSRRSTGGGARATRPGSAGWRRPCRSSRAGRRSQAADRGGPRCAWTARGPKAAQAPAWRRADRDRHPPAGRPPEDARARGGDSRLTIRARGPTPCWSSTSRPGQMVVQSPGGSPRQRHPGGPACRLAQCARRGRRGWAPRRGPGIVQPPRQGHPPDCWSWARGPACPTTRLTAQLAFAQRWRRVYLSASSTPCWAGAGGL